MRNLTVFYSVRVKINAIRKLKFSKALLLHLSSRGCSKRTFLSVSRFRLFCGRFILFFPFFFFLNQHYSLDVNNSCFLRAVSSLIHLKSASSSHSSFIWLDQRSQQAFLCSPLIKYILLLLDHPHRPSLSSVWLWATTRGVCDIPVLGMHWDIKSKTGAWNLKNCYFWAFNCDVLTFSKHF